VQEEKRKGGKKSTHLLMAKGPEDEDGEALTTPQAPIEEDAKMWVLALEKVLAGQESQRVVSRACHQRPAGGLPIDSGVWCCSFRSSWPNATCGTRGLTTEKPTASRETGRLESFIGAGFVGSKEGAAEVVPAP
jgi:hypothetical protein